GSLSRYSKSTVRRHRRVSHFEVEFAVQLLGLLFHQFNAEPGCDLAIPLLKRAPTSGHNAHIDSARSKERRRKRHWGQEKKQCNNYEPFD
ncbi:hypothetical protein Q7I37_21425, partial [Aeromonas allosaccharophila]|uniref:hypothetical protein n=1 Tax=Aeromonas allosaccharophila TaxID=656 RepID=UPI003006ADFD